MSDNDFCRIALEEGLNLCHTKEDIFLEIARLNGFVKEESLNDKYQVLEIASWYNDVLQQGLTTDDATNFDKIRMFVLAKAWEYFAEIGSAMDAFFNAWQDTMALLQPKT